MSHMKFLWTLVALLLCTLLSHSCQQPGLNAIEEDIAQEAPPAQTPETKQGTEVRTTSEPSGAVLTMTDSSDSSPDAKHANDRTAPNRNAIA